MGDEYRVAYVFIQNILAGILKESDEGYEFFYLTDYLAEEKALPVSVTMPLTSEVYKSTVLFPFFDGLIPEGWLLGVASRNWKIDPQDRFGLLLTVCKDCIGDVCIKSEAEI